MTFGEPDTPETQIRLLRIRILASRRERDELAARARERSLGVKVASMALRVTLVALWLAGAASGLFLVVLVLLLARGCRMGPG